MRQDTCDGGVRVVLSPRPPGAAGRCGRCEPSEQAQGHHLVPSPAVHRSAGAPADHESPSTASWSVIPLLIVRLEAPRSAAALRQGCATGLPEHGSPHTHLRPLPRGVCPPICPGTGVRSPGSNRRTEPPAEYRCHGRNASPDGRGRCSGSPQGGYGPAADPAARRAGARTGLLNSIGAVDIQGTARTRKSPRAWLGGSSMIR